MQALGAAAEQTGQRIAGMSYYFRSGMDSIRFALAGGSPRAGFYALDEAIRGMAAGGGEAHKVLIGVALELAEIAPLIGTVTLGWIALNDVLSRRTPLDEYLSKQNNELKAQSNWLQIVQKLREAGAITRQ